MQNRIINIQAVAEIAEALKELREQMVFVGGAVVSLYADEVAQDEVRPTTDVDLTIQMAGFSAWANIEERLRKLGFMPDSEGHVICSYRYNHIAVDIMPADDGPIGPANRWYRPGFKDLQEVVVENQPINILSAPYFLATKFEAFKSRGKDYRFSHDFEDIIFVVDNRAEIVGEIKASDETVQKFLKEEFSAIARNPNFDEDISAHIQPNMREERLPEIIEKIHQIIT